MIRRPIELNRVRMVNAWAAVVHGNRGGGIANLTDFETDLSLIIGCSKYHAVGWTQISRRQVRNALARVRWWLAAGRRWRRGRK